MNKIILNISTKKNLLAFSGGVDSTALFFLLLEQNIPFDIAIIDYNQRVQSKKEVEYAHYLAKKYNKICYTTIFSPDIKFSEKIARDYRYNFFENIIKNNSYEALLTAHQLNDKLEWFLMQFTKGAGLSELLSFQKETFKGDMFVLKPLLDYTKEQLLDYLKKNNIKYFIDKSNFDHKYKRNYFREVYSNKLLEQFSSGIKNSFDYLQNDLASLLIDTKEIKDHKLTIIEYNGDKNIAIRLVDKELKKRGFIISKATRDEILTQKEIVISSKIAISIKENKIFIAPYIQNIKMDKKFKEKCRVQKIPKNIRGYLYQKEENLC